MSRDESSDVFVTVDRGGHIACAVARATECGARAMCFANETPERYSPHAHLVDLERQLATLKNRVAEVAAFGFQSLASNENPTVRAMANSMEQLVK